MPAGTVSGMREGSLVSMSRIAAIAGSADWTLRRQHGRVGHCGYLRRPSLHILLHRRQVNNLSFELDCCQPRLPQWMRSVVQSAVSLCSKLRGTAFTLPSSASTAAGLTTAG
jgi:hypothetical protein